MSAYDYVIVGGGSAGCIVAAELAKDAQVLLLEGGPPAEEHPETLIAAGYKDAFINDAVMGERFTVRQTDAAKQRVFAGTGTVMGGSGSVNGMVYTRGARIDYAEWPEGWRWDDLQADFLAIEKVLRPNRRPATKWTEACISAAVANGFSRKADLNDGDLKVTVSVGGKTSDPLDLLNTFDPDTGLGIPGDYEAPLIPTAPGDYTFHLSGTIDGTAVDETATSSDATFNSVVDATGIQFPNQLPALTDIITRLDRIDTRLAASPAPSSGAPAPSPGPVDNAAVDAASAAAASAQSAANNALLVGGAIGAAGVIIGLAALAMAMRGRRPSA